jgi:hypothetical protein
MTSIVPTLHRVVRTQAQLTEEQAEALKEIAAERGVSVAELIRRGVEMVIAARDAPGLEERRRRALAAVGAFSDRSSDVAREHDEYFADAIGESRRGSSR